jgi:prolyl 4-hydroxylase
MSASPVTRHVRPPTFQSGIPSDKVKGRHLKSKNLTHLDARVSHFSPWVKPVCYTALGITAAALIGICLHPTQKIPSPQPTITKKLTAYGEVEVHSLSHTPRINWLPKFLTHAECDHLINLAKGSLTPSTVVGDDPGGVLMSDVRKSEGYWVPKDHDETVRKIEKLIAEITGTPIENGEALYVIKYGVGGEYKPHHDYFDPGSKELQNGGQRVATVIMYLNTPEEGGETDFPKASIKITPIKGDAVFFNNVLPDGKDDPLTLHAGTPVRKGCKWIMTRWIRERPFL